MIFSKGCCGEDGVYRPEHLCECPQHEWERLHISTPFPGQNAWYNGFFGMWTGKGGCLVLITVFRQHNLNFWLKLALFYISIFWDVATEAFPQHFRHMHL